MAICRNGAFVLVFATSACGTAPEPASKAPPDALGARPSLVLATLDTTRADRLGAYGYRGAHTPNLDRLASEGLRFEHAYAVVPLTTPAHSSILTGLYPTRHGVHTNGDAALPDSVTTLAERLQAVGYHTAASVSAFVTTKVWNLDQGFDLYDDRVSAARDPSDRWGQERPADAVVDAALAWLATQPSDAPFFLWVHFYDPHQPHNPPEAWAEQLPERPYDAEIAFMDEQIGRLREAVDARGQQGGVAWIAVADHGEAVANEHGEQGHGTFLFDPSTQVPFIIRPAVPLAGALTEAETVSNVDVTPTALGMLGLALPEDLDGVDLSPLLRGERVERPGVYLESFTVTQRFGYHPEIAAAQGGLKLMDTPSPRLFDTLADPGEEQNLAEERPEDVARLHEITVAVQARAVRAEESALAPEVAEQLAALGYMGMGGSLSASAPTIDAKDRLDTIQALDRARGLARSPETSDQALALYQEIIGREPQIVEARSGLARVQAARGQLDEAVATYREALALEPHSTVLRSNLAGMLGRQRRFDEALEQTEAILQQVPRDEGARVSTIRLMMQAGHIDEARARAQGWLAESPESHSLQAITGLSLLGSGQEEAERLLLESTTDGLPRPHVQEALARFEAERGRLPEAVDRLQRELEANPQNPPARGNLGNLYMRMQRWEDAAAEYAFLAEANDKDFEFRRGWAQAIFNTGDYSLAHELLAPALARAPEDPELLLLEANILRKLGREEEGDRTFAHAREARDAQQQESGRPGAEWIPPTELGAP